MLILKIQLPYPVFDAFKIVGGMTAPISMLIVGNILSNVKVKDLFNDWTIYYGLVIKMGIIPLAIYLFSRLINDRSIVMNTMILLEAMPAAAMTSIFASDFNKNKEYAAVFIFVTTLISIITIPIIAKLLSF